MIIKGKKLEIWNIPRSDTRDRCGDCLKPFKKKDIKHKRYKNYLRFPRICEVCFQIFRKKEYDLKISNKLDELSTG